MLNGTPPVVPPELRPRPERLRFAIAPLLDAVVHLRAQVPPQAYTAAVLGTEREGSGVVVGEDGVVLTMGYLVVEAQEIWLSGPEGEPVAGQLLGYDHETGFAVVRALGDLQAAPVEWGQAHRLRVGAPLVVAAAGGLLSAVQARLLAREEFAGYWEYLLEEALITTPAHPFWGGAACFDQDGLLVGLAALLLESPEESPADRRNMVVPIDLLQPVFDDLVHRGRARRPPRPWLGLYLRESDRGLVVAGVMEGAPAQRAGVAPGDILFEIAGIPVADLADAYRTLWSLGPAGAVVPVAVLRRGSRRRLRIRSDDRYRYIRRAEPH